MNTIYVVFLSDFAFRISTQSTGCPFCRVYLKEILGSHRKFNQSVPLSCCCCWGKGAIYSNFLCLQIAYILMYSSISSKTRILIEVTISYATICIKCISISQELFQFFCDLQEARTIKILVSRNISF